MINLILVSSMVAFWVWVLKGEAPPPEQTGNIAEPDPGEFDLY